MTEQMVQVQSDPEREVKVVPVAPTSRALALLASAAALACGVVLILGRGGVTGATGDFDRFGPVDGTFNDLEAFDKKISVDMRSAIFMTTKGYKAGPNDTITVGPHEVALGIAKGRCFSANGPLARRSAGEDAAERSLNFWSSSEKHVVCFPPRRSHKEIQFVATLRTDDEVQDEGEFGFGPEVSVSLRPDIETNAVWPLQASVESLGLELKKHQAFRALAIRANEQAVGLVHDVPLVIARPREQSTMIDIQAVDQSLASCTLDPGAGAPRFICTGRPDAHGGEVQFVAFCGGCAGQASGWDLSIERKSDSSQVLASTDSAPWAGWVASVPQNGGLQQWTASLKPRGRRLAADFGAENQKRARRLGGAAAQAAAQEALKAYEEVDRQTLDIIFVSGGAQVPFSDNFADSSSVHAAGLGLLNVAIFALISVVGASVAAVKFLPSPVLAALPSASAALGALQFIILLGASEVAPPQLRSLREPIAWLAPTELGTAISFALTVFLVVAFVHSLAVLQHLAKNGKNSGEYLPHGLLFGAWELRAFSFVVLPLAAAGSKMAASGYAGLTLSHPGSEGAQISSDGGILDLIFGSVLLVSLLVASLGIWSRVWSLIAEERVVAVELPHHEGTIFVDRVCDQLRAMPFALGNFALFGSWPASPGWCCAPAVAAIREIEHAGRPPSGMGSWRAIWPKGPWTTHMATKPSDEVTAEEVLNRSGSSLSYGKSSSMQPFFSRAGSMVSMPDEGQAGAAYDRSLSPVMLSHDVTVKVRCAYKSREEGPIAGVVGLPWLDAALPANALRILQLTYKEDDMKMCAHVGQLSGPLTSGRLSACFDWHDRCPYRWPADLLVKLLLGIYAGALPLIAVMKSATLVHASVISVILLLALAVPIIRPHVHSMDNLALSAALIAAAAGAACGQYFTHAVVPVGTPALVGTIVALVAIPIGLTAASSLLVALFAGRLRSQEQREAVDTTVDKWGSSVNEEYDRNLGTAIVTVPVETYGSDQDLRVEVPISTLATPMHMQIKLPAAPSGIRAVPADGQPRLGLPVDLLLVPAGPATYAPKTERPCGVLLYRGGVRLLYPKEEYNNGLTWQESTQQFFGPQHQELAQAAIRTIQERGARFGDNTLTTVEVVGGM